MAQDFTDFYIRYLEHPRYNQNIVDEDDPLENIIMQMEMILFTEKGEVLGDDDFGVGMEKYLWSTRFSADVIKGEIIRQFTKYIPELNSNSYKINVYITQGDYRDIGVVDIIIDGQTLRAVFA